MKFTTERSAPGWIRVLFDSEQDYEKAHEFVNEEGIRHMCNRENLTLEVSAFQVVEWTFKHL